MRLDPLPSSDSAEVRTGGVQLHAQQDSFDLQGVQIDGQSYNIRLAWQTATQGFEIVSVQATP